MSFDPRSLERLRELGRQLPQPLPKPAPSAERAKPTQARHKLETETDPEALFRELMQASPDGTVPPHLMARLRELEDNQSLSRMPGATGSAKASPMSKRTASRNSEEDLLYTAFQQLLLEDDEAGLR